MNTPVNLQTYVCWIIIRVMVHHHARAGYHHMSYENHHTCAGISEYVYWYIFIMSRLSS